MKKIAYVLMLLVLGCSVAIADTLTIDLDNASLDELMSGKRTIDQRINELNRSVQSSGEEYILKGNGTEIRAVDITLAPLSRFVFTCADPDAEYTLTVNGEEKDWISESSYFATESTISTIMVQSKKPWQLELSPIGFIDTPFITGAGNFISDRFIIDSPSIVTVTFDYSSGNGNYWNEFCSLVLYSVDEKGTVSAHYLVSGEQVYEEESITLDVIVNLDNQAQYCFWGVKCNSKIKWSIAAKE